MDLLKILQRTHLNDNEVDSLNREIQSILIQEKAHNEPICAFDDCIFYSQEYVDCLKTQIQDLETSSSD